MTSITIILILILGFGLRADSVGSDTETYIRMFQNFSGLDDYSAVGIEIGFSVFSLAIRTISENSIMFLFIISFAIQGFFLRFSFLIFNKNSWFFLLLLSIFPSFYALNINVMRQGIAIAIGFIAYYYFFNRKFVAFSILAAISVSFHISSIIPFIFLFFSGLSIRWTILFWTGCSFFSAFSPLYASLFSALNLGDKYLNYVNETSEVIYRIGPRFDFIVYSALPLLLFWFSNNHKKIATNSFNFFLWKIYFFTNGVGHFLNFIPYSDRFLIISWIIIPVLFTYSVTNFIGSIERKSKIIVYLGSLVCFFIVFSLPFLVRAS